MKFSAPKAITFLVALVIAVLAALAALGTFSIIPIPSVWLMGIAYAILALGCLLRDL